MSKTNVTNTQQNALDKKNQNEVSGKHGNKADRPSDRDMGIYAEIIQGVPQVQIAEAHKVDRSRITQIKNNVVKWLESQGEAVKVTQRRAVDLLDVVVDKSTQQALTKDLKPHELRELATVGGIAAQRTRELQGQGDNVSAIIQIVNNTGHSDLYDIDASE